jgi:peroxiredoxin
VLTPDQLTRAPYADGIVYAEDRAGSWERALGLSAIRRPQTLIVGPNGKVVWQHEGEVGSAGLAEALRSHLTAGASARGGMLRSGLRIGQPPPNFLFDYAAGQQLTLRKLAQRSVVLVFWTSSSKPSLEAVRDLQHTMESTRPSPQVLAVNDGEPAELARRVAAENRLSATLVTDPERRISLAYGVTVWPTIVFIDPSGLVRGIHQGRLAGERND